MIECICLANLAKLIYTEFMHSSQNVNEKIMCRTLCPRLIIKLSNKNKQAKQCRIVSDTSSYECTKCAAYARGKVTAPIEAEVTREAYLASTPLV